MSAEEAEGGTSMSPTSPDGMSCRNVFIRAISGANAYSFSQFIWIHKAIYLLSFIIQLKLNLHLLY